MMRQRARSRVALGRMIFFGIVVYNSQPFFNLEVRLRENKP
jgi:hypothetical protein